MKIFTRAQLGHSGHALRIGFGLLLALSGAMVAVAIALVTFHAEAGGQAPVRAALLWIAGLGAVGLAGGALAAWLTIRYVERAEKALEIEKELAESTLHSIGDGVITTGPEDRVEYLNPAAEHYTGWRGAEARGRLLPEIFRVVDARTGEAVDAPLPTVGDVSRDALDAAPLRLRSRKGREIPIRYSRAPIRGPDGALIGSIVVFHDISQIRAMAQQLSWQASHDALTGLVNRTEFERRLGELIETARVKGRQHALLYMDLDNFKAVNDSCGRRAGDEFLRQLATVMLTRMRGSDTLARLSEDEFGALLESCPLEQALRIAHALRETVREFRFVWEDKTFSMGMSIGLVPIDAGSGDPDHLLALGDACCHEARNKGGDRVQVYSRQEELSGKPGELHVVAQINRAFERGEFRLYRQAIVPLNPGLSSERRFEVLVRMVDESGALIPPTEFMLTAERYNLLTSIERWVISTLAEQLHRRWRSGAIASSAAAGVREHYSVNLSGASINDRSFPDFLRTLLTRYELPAGLLCFEITETTAISSLHTAAELMHEFKGMGCQFALDDFGTGMSSFAYLKYLPVDYLKIAGMFVKDMNTDAMDCAIVEAINRISHILGVQTVAEAVEDEATLQRVKALEVDFAQGYYVARPEAMSETEPAAGFLVRSA